MVSLRSKRAPFRLSPTQTTLKWRKALHTIKNSCQILKFMSEHITLINLVANDYEP
ncbi:hypothetical protein [Campylobacter concisus]|uniref:hypothetical protein n=1 Tax=Campylobacter concisus TaxID=199 RepID=UPI0015E18995|nr:hypothetical protein [Campylobacter concisus]